MNKINQGDTGVLFYKNKILGTFLVSSDTLLDLSVLYQIMYENIYGDLYQNVFILQDIKGNQFILTQEGNEAYFFNLQLLYERKGEYLLITDRYYLTWTNHTMLLLDFQ